MKHSTDTELKNYYAHMLSLEEEISLLEHIAECEYCAGRFAAVFPERKQLTPPPGLREGILQEIQKTPVSLDKKAAMVVSERYRLAKHSDEKLSRTTAKRELYRYSARVALAVGMALVILVCNDFTPSSKHYTQVDSVISQNHTEQEQNKISSALRQSSAAVSQALGEWSGQMAEKILGSGSGQKKK